MGFTVLLACLVHFNLHTACKIRQEQVDRFAAKQRDRSPMSTGATQQPLANSIKFFSLWRTRSISYPLTVFEIGRPLADLLWSQRRQMWPWASHRQGGEIRRSTCLYSGNHLSTADPSPPLASPPCLASFSLACFLSLFLRIQIFSFNFCFHLSDNFCFPVKKSLEWWCGCS